MKHDLVDMVSTFVPKKLRRNPNRPPWMNQEILREIRRRKRMWRTHKDSARYEDQSRMVKQMIRNAKKKLVRRLAEGGGQQQALLLLCQEPDKESGWSRTPQGRSRTTGE